MAQAVFDQHPLEVYLRDAGETQFIIPGISSDLERELEPHFDNENTDDEHLPDWRPRLLVEFLQAKLLASVANPNGASSPFVERFRYSVISSSLLSPSLSAHHNVRPSKLLPIPGNLQHSRTSSMEGANPFPPAASLPTTQTPDSSSGVTSLSAAAAAVFLTVGHPILSLLSLFATAFFMFNPFATSDTPKHDMSLTFNALQDLLSANHSWESIVQDTINFLEEEERCLHTTAASSVPSPIRVALHSCLQSTHTQCDSIRHLFSALTSPTELPQIAEMYAPPSPIKSTFSTEMAARPFSFPSAHLGSSSPDDLPSPSTPAKKRFTWNGSYLGLADAGSPTNMINRRRERQSAQLRDVFNVGNNHVEPISPLSGTKAGFSELVDAEKSKFDAHNSTSRHFGSAALDLQRTRKSAGLDVIRSLPLSAPELRGPRGFRNSMFISANPPSSKFTSPLPARHPLSFTALTFSLQGAMAAKRYACAHLLALRFSDDEDNGYWEDVRSVIGLLTSALLDASSRLSEALEEAEQQKMAEGKPTPNKTHFEGESEESQDESASASASRLQDPLAVTSGFAPMPNHISRFAAHIAAITSALDDARDHLEQCVSALKAGHDEPAKSSFMTPQRRLGHVRSLSRPYYAGNVGNGEESREGEEQEPKALQAYERLRRELGLALRECERGRERLLEIVYPPPPILSDDEEEDLPGLGHDLSDDSDKLDPISPRSEVEAEYTEVRPIPQVVNSFGGGMESVDDATGHLLLTSTAQHLPLPGIEEVFEAETGPKVSFLRERSKLSREERIRLVKSKRGSEGGHGLGLSGIGEGREGKLERERWGPGGEVVQELKDVIWKVGERKRRMTEVSQTASQDQEQDDPFLDPKPEES